MTSERLLTRVATAALLAVASWGCDTERLSDGLPDGGRVLDHDAALGCTSCHGSANPAPPEAVGGETATTHLGVGAHQAHYAGGDLRQGWQEDCDVCHAPVDPAADVRAHIDGVPAEMEFDGLAVADGATPTWNRTTGTCSGVYCHGATLAGGGGGNTRPVWTAVDGTQDACGTCHGAPPPPPHPASSSCSSCHPDTVDGSNRIDVAGGFHINGTVDVGSMACTGCHGSDANPAPPRSTGGSTSTTDVEVGAHQRHLAAGSLAPALECTACHVRVTSVGQAGHLDTPPAELVWGALATADGAAPSWDRTAETCSGTYCHGATLSGGTNTAPTWTDVGSGQTACGTCHGAPPPPPHPVSSACGACHAGTVNGDGSVNVAGGLHLNGAVDVSPMQCNACHGSAANPAPPQATNGSTDPTDVEVGAHQGHVTAGDVSAGLACSACHVPVTSVDQSGHRDGGPAELTWGALATTGGATPVWDRSAASCAGTYCHGATLSGGSRPTPSWTAGGEADCGWCHGAPPPPPHPASSSCQMCHAETVNGDGSINVAGGRHLDGTVQVSAMECNSCHGSAANAAPPQAVDGTTATTAVPVGAHQEHVVAGEVRGPMDCSACHVAVVTVGQPGHVDASPAEVVWGALAAADGATPEWDRATATCTGTYCHGATLAGGTNPDPTWTDVGAGQAACGACHGGPPPPPHPQLTSCHDCHATVDALGEIDLAGGLHVNGTVDADRVHADPAWRTSHGGVANQGLGACTPCHGAALDGGAVGVSCETCHSGWRSDCAFCHGGGDSATGAPPVDLGDRTATTFVTVGAHTPHLAGAAGLASPVACGECHLVPATVFSAGHIDPGPAEVRWSGRAVLDGQAPAWNRAAATCTGTYCHGASQPGGTNTAPTWTGVGTGQAACGACHGAPPATGKHGTVFVQHEGTTPWCHLCHGPVTVAAGASSVIGDEALHLDGAITVQPIGGTWDAATRTCAPACHGPQVW